MAHKLAEVPRNGCDCSMRRKRKIFKKGTRNYWWNQEIAELRSEANKARRIFQRSIGTLEADSKLIDFKAKRKALKYAIKNSKREKFRELCETVESDPWGLGYKIVLKRLKSYSEQAPNNPSEMESIIKALFPVDTEDIPEDTATQCRNCPGVTKTEVLEAADDFS